MSSERSARLRRSPATPSSTGATDSTTPPESTTRSRERLVLTERPLTRLNDGTATAVAPRLRSLLLAALDGGGRAVGAVNTFRWGRPLWTDDASALSPIRLSVPVGAQQSRTETVSLVVESGPNHAHPLRARSVAPGGVPDDATPLSLAALSPDVVRSLAPLVETGRARLPAASRAFRQLEGDERAPPAVSRTLCHLEWGDDCYRIERPGFEPPATPLSYLVASAHPTTRSPVATVSLPPVERRTARLFGQALRDRTNSVTVESLPREVRDLAANDFVLTPGGVYEATVGG